MNEEKIRWLKSYRGLVAEIERLQREIERWRSIAEKVTPSISAVRYTAPDGSRIENAIEKIDTLRDSLAAKLDELIGCRIQIEQAIDAVEDDRLRLLLRYRYIDGMTIEEAANEMGISRQWISVLQREALDMLPLG